ncbi:uncharacterized protein LOC130649161 [Hydractinia symbiolongicarpus]|uniref:uncharacterized protein LOC130649161 n=1 Tax=Hydractinia symbiolongicarpus TaxID=13093 RepID=UPI002550B88D|nr:uncharacterized protein LOC130649161 [Hydractinia symbiolongicarpus]
MVAHGCHAKKINKYQNNFISISNRTHLNFKSKLKSNQNKFTSFKFDLKVKVALWLRVWDSNSKPELIGKWYLEHLCKTNIIPAYIRIDKGTETGVMATMQSYLRRNCEDLDDPTESVCYGPSTSNQIERWWKELHERLEKYFKDGLQWLKEERHYDPHNEADRNIMKYVMIPLIQRELDEFREIVWNTHRIRKQKNTILPDGIPNHIYDFPQEYDLLECGFPVNDKELEDVADLSNVLSETTEDYIDEAFRNKCQNILPDPAKISATKYVESYLLLKNNIT